MPKPTNFATFFSVYTAQDVPDNHQGEYRLDCPLVGCENPDKHFYANCSDGTWHCKRCDRSGNARTLITNIWQQNFDTTEPQHYAYLSEVRGIPTEVFESCGWAFDSANNRWLVPYFTYDPEKEEISEFLNNLGYFYPYSTSKDRFTIKKSGALPLYLYNGGWQELPPSNTAVICEGEWDTLAYMALNPDSTELILGKAGAGFNKSYMKTLSKMERVILLLDNDAAGRAQTTSATEVIAETVPSIYGIDWDLVEWPETAKDKKDIRDLYKAVGMQSYSKIERALVKSDKGAATTPVNKTAQTLYQTSLSNYKQVESFEDYTNTAKSYLYVTPETIMAMAATIGITNSIVIPGEPLWAFLIGPPSSGKTTFIDSFGGNNELFDNLSKISAKALVSGWRDETGDEPSYLARLKDKTLFVKDFTVTLTDTQDSQKEVFGLLTDIFDGYVKIPYGNNQVREFYDLYFNMVAGVTDIVHSHSAASIGERFLRIDFLGREYNARQFATQALLNFGKMKSQKEALTKNTLGFVNYLKSMPFPMEIPGEYLEPITDLAEFIATIRTKVESDRQEGIKYRPRTELPARLAITLAKLFVSTRVVYNKDPNKEESTIHASKLAFDVVKKVAFDTCYGFPLDLVKVIHKNPNATRDILAIKANIHQQKAYRILDDLITTGVITKANGQAGVKGGRPAHLYSINPKLKAVLDHDAANTESTKRIPVSPTRRP